MRGKKPSTGLTVALAILTIISFLTGVRSFAQEERVLLNYNGKDGANPYAGLIANAAGNLYGTTGNGGDYNSGTVFELTPGAGGSWTETVLHSFGSGTDGTAPLGSLVLDAAGNLYGTTLGGGAYGGGTAFELTPASGGAWTETVIHAFDYFPDGYSPNGNLIFDSSGNLYGTTEYGGNVDLGTVFELTPASGGGWTETVLYFFTNGIDTGAQPVGGLIFDAAGNLYGIAYAGGPGGGGAVFVLRPATGGTWKETLIHTFANGHPEDGFDPNGGLVFDASANLYGTTKFGGGATANCPSGCGTLYELTPHVGGHWSEKILHHFSDNGTDGYFPNGGLIFGADTRLYGVTEYGGSASFCGCGTAFGLTPTTGAEKILHSFASSRADGIRPQGLVLFYAGNLYGTTTADGVYGFGTVFEVRP